MTEKETRESREMFWHRMAWRACVSSGLLPGVWTKISCTYARKLTNWSIDPVPMTADIAALDLQCYCVKYLANELDTRSAVALVRPDTI